MNNRDNLVGRTVVVSAGVAETFLHSKCPSHGVDLSQVGRYTVSIDEPFSVELF